MKRQVVGCFCFTGNGILLLLLLLFGITAVPTPSPTQTMPDILITTSSTERAEVTTVTSTTGTQNASIAPAADVLQDRDPPAIINNENVTETEIVITESRHGKSLHHSHPHNHQDLIKGNDSNVATTENSSSSDFTEKLATDNDHLSQQLSGGDAPLKAVVDKDPKGKKQEWQEPRLVFIPSTAAVPTERDKMIQRIFGGECNFSHWNRCSRIEFWGGDYLVPDKNNPGKFIVRNHKIKCSERPKSTICLRNGWTVARCHMLCMSQCNVEYRMDYEKLVLHEGDCRLPILFK